VYPALHRHPTTRLLPLGESEFAGQSVHVLYAEAPRVSEYLPASQSTQELATKAPISGEYLPAPQSTQELSVVDATVVEYCPALQ
jgi:hypothetical protein